MLHKIVICPLLPADSFAWGDMAVLCRDAKTRDLCARTLAQRGLPVQNRIGPGHYDPLANSVKVMTMRVSKGLEFPVVALPGVEDLGRVEEVGSEAETGLAAEVDVRRAAARVLYVAATRATQRLILGREEVGILGGGWKVNNGIDAINKKLAKAT